MKKLLVAALLVAVSVPALAQDGPVATEGKMIVTSTGESLA